MITEEELDRLRGIAPPEERNRWFHEYMRASKELGSYVLPPLEELDPTNPFHLRLLQEAYRKVRAMRLAGLTHQCPHER